jgi:phosphatidylglycerol lysyltransferase
MKKALSYAGPVVGFILFIFAVIVLHKELVHYHYHEIANELKQIPHSSVLIAILFTVCNFLVLGGYEILGFRYIQNGLSRAKIALTSFIAFSFSNNVGFYSISGSAVRYRLYSHWGLSTLDITRLITFSSGVAFWLGLCSICSIVFLLEPVAIPAVLHLPFSSTRFLGVIFLIPVVSFIVLTIFKKQPIRFRSWEFEIPSVWLTLGLIGLACLDWCFFAAILYALLPAHTVSFPVFLSVFLTAQTVGLASHVPGGLGVFESVFILLFPEIPVSAKVGSLMVFRAVYYLLPLGLSAVLMGSYELVQRKHQVSKAAAIVSQWGSAVVPHFFSIITFMGGIILLFSGATPADHHRMHWLTHVMPLPVLEISHFMASIMGVMLLILAWGIHQRRDSAWHLTLYLLAGGALFSLLKGIDYEEAIILIVMFFILLPAGHHFYRKTSFTNDRFSPGWFIAISIVIASSIWLGFFSYKHITYSNELWWQFSFHSHVSRFLRAGVGSIVVFCAFAIFKLISPVRITISLRTDIDETVIRPIIQTSTSTTAQLALLGDKNFLISEKRDAFIMYGISGRSMISMGDPVGNDSSCMSLIWQFRDLCDQQNAWPVFYEINTEQLPRYLDIGLTLLKMGEEARVDLHEFSLEGGSKKSFRYNKKRIESEGFSFEIVPLHQIEANMPVLREISNTWLAHKNTREKRFSLGFFDERYLKENPIAVVRKGDSIVAFANLWLTYNKTELSIDLMRYVSTAPKGVMDYLFTNIILWGKEQGYSWFNLGMAPFSGMESKRYAPLWNRLGSFLFNHGEEIYNFQGLRQFKEKFDPVWQPKYMAVPGGFSLPLILRDISTLISGGLKGVFSK